MNEQIKNLVQQIRRLEEELSDILKAQEKEIRYRVYGKRIEFEKKLRESHQKLKVGIYRWLRESEFNNVLSAPFIYGMLIPLLFLDLTLTLYQIVCFRLYRIPRVSHSEYMIFDRQHLAYLNLIEKINCTYCAYAVGLFAYAREISARTEQYWCPIKHAGKLQHPDQRGFYFIPYGEGKNFQAKQAAFRRALAKGEIPVVNVDDTDDEVESASADKDKSKF